VVIVRVAQVTRAAADESADASFTHVRLEVEDTGIGMSESFRKNMFQAFRQESQDPRSSHKGSGLGLSITKRLVELLHGDIAVESEKGEGTRFTIHLPRDPREDTNGAETTASPPTNDERTDPSEAEAAQVETEAGDPAA
jgi:signal transduction histidine kinase